MDDANHLLGDPAALMTELNEKGYLLIRGLHDRAEVLTWACFRPGGSSPDVDMMMMMSHLPRARASRRTATP